MGLIKLRCAQSKGLQEEYLENTGAALFKTDLKPPHSGLQNDST